VARAVGPGRGEVALGRACARPPDGANVGTVRTPTTRSKAPWWRWRSAAVLGIGLLATSCGLLTGGPVVDPDVADTDAVVTALDTDAVVPEQPAGQGEESHDEGPGPPPVQEVVTPAAAPDAPTGHAPSTVSTTDLVDVGRAAPRPEEVDPWTGAPAQDEAVRGWLAQDRLPAFEARASRARARQQALRAYLDGEGDLREALPDLAPERLHETALIEARLRALDLRGEARATEAARRPPGQAGPARKEAIAGLRAALEAESRADQAEREVLLGMRAWLRERPELSAAELQVVLRPWEERITRMRGLDPDDPASAGALARGLSAQEALSRLGDTLAELRDHRLAGRDLPDPGPEGLALAARDEAAALALAWRHPVLSPDGQADAMEAIGTLVDTEMGRLAVVREGVVDEERLPVPTAMAAVQRAEARRDALPILLQPLAQARVDVAEARLIHAEQPVLSLADAEATRREAEEAREASRDATAERTALLIEARLPAEARVEALTEQVEAARDIAATQRNSAADVLVEARQAQATTTETGLPPDDVGTTYGDLRSLLATLRARARTADEAVSEASSQRRTASETLSAELARVRVEERALDDLAEPEVRAQREAALSRWAGVLAEEKRLLDARVEVATEAREVALRQLTEAARLRRTLAPWVGRAQRAEDQDGLFREIADELSVVGPAYLATLRQRGTELAEDPWWFVRLGVLRDVALGSLWLLAAAAVWLLARRYADSLVGAAMRQVLSQTRRVRASDVEPLRDPLRRLLVTTVDVVAAWMLFGMVPDGLPELAVVLLLIFELQLLRLELAVYDLVVGESASLRPALVRLPHSAWVLGRRTVLAFGLWSSAFRILDAFVEDVIAGYATGLLLGTLRWIVFLVLAVVLLYLWAPFVRGRIVRHPRSSTLTQFLGAKPPTVLLAGPLALGGILFLTTVFLRDLVFRIARQGAVARWFATVDRLRLGRGSEEATTDVKPLAPEVVQGLINGAADRAFVDRPKVRKRLVDEVLAWRDGPKQGLVALLGDTGDGRRAAIEHWKADWENERVGTLTLQIDVRLATRRDALVWLAHALELAEVPDDEEAAIAALAGRMDPGVVVVHGLHLAFLRTVGGFDALRTLLEVWHADRQRCWILCFYRPSWRYLERLGTALNIHLVQEVVDLTPLDGPALRELTRDLTEPAGIELDFSALVSTGALAGDPEVERERAIESYYRLLATASAGNPAVALDLWAGCLSRVEEPEAAGETGEASEDQAPTRLAVRVSQELRSTPVADLGDEQLFVLAAVRVQGELDEAELAEVLNMGAAQVRALVRQLVSGGRLQRSDRGVHLVRQQLPTITLTLRRRHFLHGGTG